MFTPCTTLRFITIFPPKFHSSTEYTPLCYGPKGPHTYQKEKTRLKQLHVEKRALLFCILTRVHDFQSYNQTSNERTPYIDLLMRSINSSSYILPKRIITPISSKMSPSRTTRFWDGKTSLIPPSSCLVHRKSRRK